MFAKRPITTQKPICYHCGDECANEQVNIAEKYFCCTGCRSVYELLNENDLCTYYSLNQNPGATIIKEIRFDKFAFLEDKEIAKKLIQYSDGKTTQLTFYIPQIHCSSCLWLLENIHTIDSGIIDSRVNFNLKEVFVKYEEGVTSLRKIVELLTQLGYEPHLSLNELSEKHTTRIDRTRWYKIGVAGFSFANIMMMSFAGYLAISNQVDAKIDYVFKIVSIALAIPVLLYSANEFFISAWNGIKNKYINIDFPIALALSITFGRSLYEIVNGVGNGFLDSLTGIVFFMLIGRWLQARTNNSLAFDRDYKSFFPIALNVLVADRITPTALYLIKKNDLIQIHSNELIPIDSIVSKGDARIDYSFVSGESNPISVKIGEIIYAGGKQLGAAIEIVALKSVSQSYLTNLWNNPIFKGKTDGKKRATIYDAIGVYFTYVVLAIGTMAAAYWYVLDQQTLMWNALTTVLIVACPCALLLSQNYTNGNVMRIFAMNKFYLKSADVLNKMSRVTHIVLDKTGTLTQANSSRVQYVGLQLNDQVKGYAASLAKQSSHPSSQLIYDYLQEQGSVAITDFKEHEGQGIEAWIDDHHVKIGSIAFIGGEFASGTTGSKVVLYIDGQIVGDFTIKSKYRLGVSQLLKSLKTRYTLTVLSGDNDSEAKTLTDMLGTETKLLFNQSPQQKLDYIRHLQNSYHYNILMIGDGLNDAGALKQSDIGIAVADAKNSFTPSSDAIIDAGQLAHIDTFLSFAHQARSIILVTFALSAIYNAIGLFFAVQGTLSPLVAAVLMPISSVSIIILTYGLSQWMARINKLMH